MERVLLLCSMTRDEVLPLYRFPLCFHNHHYHSIPRMCPNVTRVLYGGTRTPTDVSRVRSGSLGPRFHYFPTKEIHYIKKHTTLSSWINDEYQTGPPPRGGMWSSGEREVEDREDRRPSNRPLFFLLSVLSTTLLTRRLVFPH